MITSNSEKITVLLLSENHTIKPFDCEDEDLNDFLFKEAILYQKQMLTTTFIIENEERTLGFYSVLNDSLQIREELFPSKSQYKKFVQNLIPHRKRHLKNIISDCIELNKRQACRLITVDAYRQALPFYERFGFQYITNKDEQEEVRQMFLDLMLI